MLECVILRQQFDQMLRSVGKAVAEYDRLAQVTDDPHRRGQLLKIARDKCRHLEMAERLIEILDE